jgi:hypothetical protein
MSEKVVLPKFDLPGDRIHPALKVLLAVGALMVVSLLILGGAIWHRRSLQLAAEQRQEALIKARVAEAEAAAEAAKARQAEAAAKAAAEQAKLAAKLAPKTEGKLADASDPSKAVHRHKARKPASKALAKAGDTADKSSSKGSGGSKRDDAAIDKLLASFKK